MLWIATFGFGQTDGAGRSLAGCYVEIEAPDRETARAEIIALRGAKWSFLYDSPEAAGVSRFQLRRVTFDEVRLPPESACPAPTVPPN